MGNETKKGEQNKTRGTGSRKRNDSKELSAFMRQALRTIVQNDQHQLLELTTIVRNKDGTPARYKSGPSRGRIKRVWRTAKPEDTGRTGKRAMGRYHGSNKNWVVQAGHLTTHKGSPNNYLALEWADGNMVKPVAEKLGVVFNAVGVDIDGVLVEYSTAKLLAKDESFQGFTPEDLKKAKKVTTPMYEELARRYPPSAKKKRKSAKSRREAKKRRAKRKRLAHKAMIEEKRKKKKSKPRQRSKKTAAENLPVPTSTSDKGIGQRSTERNRTSGQKKRQGRLGGGSRSARTAVRSAGVELSEAGMSLLRIYAIQVFRKRKAALIRELRLEGNWVALYVVVEVPDGVDPFAGANPVNPEIVKDVGVQHGRTKESAMNPPREKQWDRADRNQRSGPVPRKGYHFLHKPLALYPPLKTPNNDDLRIGGSYYPVALDDKSKAADAHIFARKLTIFGGTIDSYQPIFFSNSNDRSIRQLTMSGRAKLKVTSNFAVRTKITVPHGFVESFKPYFTILSELESKELASGHVVFLERFLAGYNKTPSSLYVHKKASSVQGGTIAWIKMGSDLNEVLGID